LEYQKYGKVSGTKGDEGGSTGGRTRQGGAETADGLNCTLLCERGKYRDSCAGQATAASCHTLRLPYGEKL